MEPGGRGRGPLRREVRQAVFEYANRTLEPAKIEAGGTFRHLANRAGQFRPIWEFIEGSFRIFQIALSKEGPDDAGVAASDAGPRSEPQEAQ